MNTVDQRLHISHGYELHRDTSGNPFVLRKWTRRYKNKDGDKCIEEKEDRCELFKADTWPANQTAAEVRLEMQGAWRELREWSAANGRTA